ncbi:hypothetical protein GCM10018954_083950 [Kutzneria kofuensis]
MRAKSRKSPTDSRSASCRPASGGGVTAGPLRPGIEDLLGAGAVAAALLATNSSGASPETRLAASCFSHEIENVVELLRGCASGRELTADGHTADVELAAAVGSSSCAPVLSDGVLTNRLSA